MKCQEPLVRVAKELGSQFCLRIRETFLREYYINIYGIFVWDSFQIRRKAIWNRDTTGTSDITIEEGIVYCDNE